MQDQTPVGRLILVPAFLTLAVTLLGLAGELMNGSPTFFSRAGGGGALSLGSSGWCRCSASIVYFGREETFDRDDVLAPVLQKEPAGDRVVCYCFAVTEKDLGREIVETGRSRVAAEIAVHVKAERCACEVKNPQGSCCLGNLASAVAALL